jgi:hypothetical protein
MLGLIMNMYPHKVDQSKLKLILLQKNEYDLVKLSNFEQVIGNG